MPLNSNCQTVTQAEAKRIYCLTQKDMQVLKLFGATRTQQRQRPPRIVSLDKQLVLNYALNKHGGTQQGISLAIMQRRAASLQRDSVIKCNILLRKARTARVRYGFEACCSMHCCYYRV